MKSKFILDIDFHAPISANIDFLNNCEKEIKRKKKQLQKLEKQRQITNQLTIEDAIERNTSGTIHKAP